MTTPKYDSKFKSFIISLLRRGTFRWRPRGDAKRKRRCVIGKFKNGKDKYGYQCDCCHGKFMDKDTIMDHIIPVVDPKEGFIDFDTYIIRMYPQEDGFQVLCTKCADEKTKKENELRKYYRNLNKPQMKLKKRKQK